MGVATPITFREWLTGRRSARDGERKQGAADASHGVLRGLELGPDHADAAPARERADHLLALLLPNYDVGRALALFEKLLVLDLAVELEKDPELRPREVHDRDHVSLVV